MVSFRLQCSEPIREMRRVHRVTNQMNLFVARRRSDAATEDERGKLEVRIV